MEHSVHFRRTIIGFRDAYGSAASLEAVVRISQALRTELLGVFVQDAGLLSWMDTPPAAGRRITEATRPAPAGRYRQAFEATERLARQRLMRAAATLGSEVAFRVAQASAASLDIGDGDPGDLLVVIEPTDPTARMSYPFNAVLQAIAADSRPVLYVPSRVRVRPGPVVDLAGEIDAVVSGFAAELAVALERRLIRLHAEANLHAAHAALARTEESLIVLARKSAAVRTADFVRLAAERMVPVLIAGAGA